VTAIKSLWASVQGDPVFMRRVNGWLTIFWIAMIPISIMLGLLSSVAYVSALSLWALVSGHWSAWQAARVEVAQQAEIEAQQQDPVEDKVVDVLIARTDIGARAEAAGVCPAQGPTPRSIDQRIADLVEAVGELQQALADGR
jgi:hypothetical protein